MLQDKYNIQIGVAKTTKADSPISGDSNLQAKLEDGKYLLALSDGMGSGPEARKSSKIAIKMLERLLEAGCEYYLKQGCTLPFSLSVDKDNIPAITLYKKLGFQEQVPVNEVEEDNTQYIMESTFDEVYHNILSTQRIKNVKNN